MRVAIQGELGSFSHAAAMNMLPHPKILPCAVSADVFQAVLRKRADVAVIPIENTLAGPVTEHYDLLLKHDLFIHAESHLRIAHCLIASHGSKLSAVRRVYSHPVALDQCRGFFRAYPTIIAQAFYDTAGSVKHIVESGLLDAAAIAGEHAAKQYRAKILKRGLEDNKKNFTRFFLISRTRRFATHGNKTSIAFALKNEAGALHRALAAFAEREISLSKLESRPVPGKPWEYVFYADLLRGNDAATRAALRDLRRAASMVKILGVYRAA